jgi:hypothetical protein
MGRDQLEYSMLTAGRCFRPEAFVETCAFMDNGEHISEFGSIRRHVDVGMGKIGSAPIWRRCIAVLSESSVQHTGLDQVST